MTNTINLLEKNEIAELLKTTPEALLAFEEQYTKKCLNDKPPRFRKNKQKTVDKKLIDQIVNELMAETRVFKYKNKKCSIPKLPAMTETTDIKTLNAIPKEIRPQASHNGITLDMPFGSTGPAILFMYKQAQKEKDLKKKQEFYGFFRNGLDTLDIDPISYRLLDSFQTSMGYWLPKLIQANKDFFKIPNTTIAKLPMSLLQLTRIDYGQINPTTHEIVNQYAQKVFETEPDKDYFVKTGIYSSKFDFRNAHVTGASEIAEIGDYLLYIHNKSVAIAGQNNIYGIATTNEWVVREFIPDKEKNPMIYKGLPLHTEYRIFVDCDNDEVLAVHPYWEPETMKQRFGHEADRNTPDMIHDYISYRSHEETLMNRFYENKDLIYKKIQDLLPDLKLSGHWSIDVMQNGDDFWLIDMAPGETSAFYEKAVPKEKQLTANYGLWTALTEK